MTRLLREPLVHFLGIGLLLFVLYALVAPRDTGGERIVLSAEIVAGLQAQYQQLWGRPPTATELQGLVDARITDEILYREGLTLGLDREDPVIKRRVRQKYELIAEEADSVAPTDADLQAYLEAHADTFRRPAVVTFAQVLLPAEGTRAEMEAGVAAARSSLDRGTPPERVGRPTLLPLRAEQQPLDLVARGFGEEFAAALPALPVGQWAGPVASGYGLHLVRLEARSEPELPPLTDVRAEVQREWESEQRRKARQARIEELRRKYDVVVEGQP